MYTTVQGMQLELLAITKPPGPQGPNRTGRHVAAWVAGHLCAGAPPRLRVRRRGAAAAPPCCCRRAPPRPPPAAPRLAQTRAPAPPARARAACAAPAARLAAGLPLRPRRARSRHRPAQARGCHTGSMLRSKPRAQRRQAKNPAAPADSRHFQPSHRALLRACTSEPCTGVLNTQRSLWK